MTKKYCAFITSICLIFCALEAYGETITRELWVQRPTGGMGMTEDKVRIYKSQYADELEIYSLENAGENMYLGVCEGKTYNGGYNGKTKTSTVYLYSMIAKDGDFVTLSSVEAYNEFYWDGGVSIMDISSMIDPNKYTGDVPKYIISPRNKYSNSNLDIEDREEYYVVCESGKLYDISINGDIWMATLCITDGMLWQSNYAYKNRNSWRYYYIGDSSDKSYYLEKKIFGSGDSLSKYVPLDSFTEANGYRVIEEEFNSNMTGYSRSDNVYKSTTNDDMICLFPGYTGNTFSDGRYVVGDWSPMGAGISKLMYYIYDAKGTLLSLGDTGYSTDNATFVGDYNPIALTLNDTNFLLMVDNINNNWNREYYRASVAFEDTNGNITSAGEIGIKHFSPLTGSEISFMNNTIDFDTDDIQVGFKIQNGVIDYTKLSNELREKINIIRLNDIVIIKRNGAQSGSQNSGAVLGSESFYESIGSAKVRLYSNGQNFNWYCSNCEDLSEGDRSYIFDIDEYKIYVNIKVIPSPSNDGIVSVVF